MEETPLVANYLILFREIATSKLALNENSKLRNSLTNACINFRHYSANNANQTLFTLFYGEKAKHEQILRKLFNNTGASSLESGLEINSQYIPNFKGEDFQVFADELLYQYSAAHPDFLVVETTNSEYQKELYNLKTIMSEHPILLFRAVQMCKSVCHIEHIVSYGIRLLLSKRTINQARGLEAIGCNFQHRVLLLPYAKPIGLLLQAMHKAKVTNSVSPFTIWLNQHEESDFVPDELPQYLLLSESENFLKGKSNLISSLPRSEDLKKCLILFKDNLNSLLEKEEYLQFTITLVRLLYAKRLYQEAQDAFSLGNKESLKALSNSMSNLKSAETSYNSALNVFIESCS